MPEPATRAEQRAGEREAARRREAADLLRLTAGLAAYASAQLADGLSPEQARQAALEAAGELAAASAALRRLARLRPAQRREMARELAGLGMSRREVARRLGVSDRAVWGYLADRPAGEAL